MNSNRRVVQISLDIVVGRDCDGTVLAYDVTDELNRRGFKVIGADFKEDMTEVYKEHYSNLLED